MPEIEKILVCGDRHWDDYELVRDTIEACLENARERGYRSIELVSGGQRKWLHDEWVGADWHVIEAALELQIPVHVYPAEWKRYGALGMAKAAGNERNQQQLDAEEPDKCLAFHDNIEDSKGTADMLERASKAGVETALVTH